MKRTPRELAEACYAVARSTAHAGERDAAIGRGDAIVARHQLDPKSFDVPGRLRPRAPRARVHATTFDFRGLDEQGLAEAIARMGEALRGAQERAFADVLRGETPYDARRRNFDRETAAARARDQRRG